MIRLYPGASRLSWSAVLMLAALLASVAGAGDADLGRQIYHSGTSEGGPAIVAVLGGGAEVPATALPCVGCHGADGRGNEEGGVSPSDLTWAALTKPYGVDHPSGRAHPPYDQRSLKRAMTLGLDPAGNELHVAMPRYRLTHQQADALVAYLQGLGQEQAPGVGKDHVALGVVLPPEGRLSEWSRAVRAALDAYADRLNGRGGLFGRQLTLSYLAASEDPAERRSAVARFLDGDPVFALVGAFMAGAEEELAGLSAERQIPSIGPFTLDPQVAFPLNRQVFYLQPGSAQQAQALVDYAALHLRGPEGQAAMTLVHSRGEPLEKVAAAAMEQGRKHEGSWDGVHPMPFESASFDPRTVASEALSVDSPGVLFLGNDGETAAFLAEFLPATERANGRPSILVLSSLAGAAVRMVEDSQAERLLLAFPASSTDRSTRAEAAYRELSARYDLPAESATLQLAALSAMELLVEGLQRAGRDLTREKLITALETLHRFETGLTPPLTFGPNRRIGAMGAYVLPLSQRRVRAPTAADWVDVR